MAQTTSEVWNTRWSASRRANRGKPVDNFFESYNVLAAFRGGAMQILDTGGKEITVNLESSGGTAQAFSQLDPLAKTQGDPIESAHYKRRYYAAPVVISDTDNWENSGKEQIFNQLNALGDNAFNTLLKAINEDIVGAQTGKTMLGTQDIIDDAGTGTIGGINSSTSTFWKNQKDTTAKTFLTQTTTNIFDGIDLMNGMMDLCMIQGGNNFMILTTFSIAAAYRIALSSQGYGEINITKGGGIGGPKLPPFYGYKLVADNDVQALGLYFVETRHNKLNVMKQANFQKTDFVSLQSNGQLGQIAYQVAGVQYTTDNRRRSGVLTALTGA
jgi:hypothetical protein